jgi:hypothetical protein
MRKFANQIMTAKAMRGRVRSPRVALILHIVAKKKSGGRTQTAALKFRILQEFYEDLYLTEQPYGFVSGVATDLPDND